MKNRVKTSLIMLSVAIGINIVFALIKLFVGIETNSLCIMLDSVNNFFDTVTGVVSMIAFVRVGARLTEKYPLVLAEANTWRDLS